MDYYSAIKRNEVAMCYNVMLENIMLSERNQKQGHACIGIPLTGNIQNR